MSDFSYVQACPFCRQRYAPDDGLCTCPGSMAYQEEMDEQQFYTEGPGGEEDDERR